MRALRSKLTYANVISTICLFLLLGGGAAVAAGQLANNSVGTAQLKKRRRHRAEDQAGEHRNGQADRARDPWKGLNPRRPASTA